MLGFRLGRPLAAALLLFGIPEAFPEEPSNPEVQGHLMRSMGEVPLAISGNSAAIVDTPGTGALGRFLGIPDDLGIKLGGVWLGDANGLISGGAQPGKWTFNSLLLVGLKVYAEKFIGWEGASFGIQFLQFNGQDTNGQAGSVQGYNSLVATPPYNNRTELYSLWYRQSLFDDKVSFLIGKLVPTVDFNNVTRPVQTRDDELTIPSVTGLLFTPVYVQPTLLGAIPGYPNSAAGLTVTFTPTNNTYFKYGFYDGNVANGVNTGLTGPHFNGYYFNIWEAGLQWVLADKYPGQVGTGLWYQTGVLTGPNDVSENGTGGFYMFGGQRIWGAERHVKVGKETPGGKAKALVGGEPVADPSISAFFQFGFNNSETLPMNQSFGMGLTGFSLIPFRPNDSLGLGMSWAWLNPNIFDRSSELMFQGYYQVHLAKSVFFQPAVTYIPTPGASSSLGGAWAITFRTAVLF